MEKADATEVGSVSCNPIKTLVNRWGRGDDVAVEEFNLGALEGSKVFRAVTSGSALFQVKVFAFTALMDLLAIWIGSPVLSRPMIAWPSNQRWKMEKLEMFLGWVQWQ
jgi:hypothetical protein